MHFSIKICKYDVSNESQQTGTGCMKLGFTLGNRSVLFGATTNQEMIELSEMADASGRFQSVWVGDSLFGKPRMEAIVLLSGLARGPGTCAWVLPAWPASPLRDPAQLAYQWASLDLLAEGRTVMVACTGIVQQQGGSGRSRDVQRHQQGSRGAADRVDRDSQAALDRG